MEEQRKRSEKRRRETSRRKQWRKWKGGLRQQAFLHRAISRSHLAINLIAFLSASILPLCAPLFTFPWLDAQDRSTVFLRSKAHPRPVPHDILPFGYGMLRFQCDPFDIRLCFHFHGANVLHCGAHNRVLVVRCFSLSFQYYGLNGPARFRENTWEEMRNVSQFKRQLEKCLQEENGSSSRKFKLNFCYKAFLFYYSIIDNR